MAQAEAATPAKADAAPAEPTVRDELEAQFAAEAAAEAAAQAQATESGPPPSRLVMLLSMPLRIGVAILVLIDVPFSFLGAGVKRIIGGVAIITAIMAAATWIAGPHLSAALAAQAEKKPVAESPAAHGEKTHGFAKAQAEHE